MSGDINTPINSRYLLGVRKNEQFTFINSLSSESSVEKFSAFTSVGFKSKLFSFMVFPLRVFYLNNASYTFWLSLINLLILTVAGLFSQSALKIACIAIDSLTSLVSLTPRGPLVLL